MFMPRSRAERFGRRRRIGERTLVGVRAVARSPAEDGPRHEEPGGRKKRELIHPDSDHPRRELIESYAEGEGHARQRSDNGTENE